MKGGSFAYVGVLACGARWVTDGEALEGVSHA